MSYLKNFAVWMFIEYKQTNTQTDKQSIYVYIENNQIYVEIKQEGIKPGESLEYEYES